jgi:hypothetical protein
MILNYLSSAKQKETIEDTHSKATTTLLIAFNEEGVPMLPSVDPESVSVTMCRQLLVQYIEAAWSEFLILRSADWL